MLALEILAGVATVNLLVVAFGYRAETLRRRQLVRGGRRRW